MTIVYELACQGAPANAGAAQAWFDGGPRRTWVALPGLASFDVYVPAAGRARDPYVDDGPGPLMLVVFGFADAETLADALQTQAYRQAIAALPAGISATADAMERRSYPVAGEVLPRPLSAPLSYVVRYHRPAVDEQAFVENYVAIHPPTLATLPGIRNILCDFPLHWQDPAGLPSAGYMLGNEVVFDSIDAFNAAMASPIRHELRAHFKSFPPFSGRNTHYPMDRTRLAG